MNKILTLIAGSIASLQGGTEITKLACLDGSAVKKDVEIVKYDKALWDAQNGIFSAENPEEELSFAKSCLRVPGNKIQIAEKETLDINDFKKELTEIVRGNRDEILSAWKKIIEDPAAQLSFNNNQVVASTLVQYLHRWWSTASEDHKKAIALRLLGLPSNTTDVPTIKTQLRKVNTFIKATAFWEILEEIFNEIKMYLDQTK